MAKSHLSEVPPVGSPKLCIELCRRMDGGTAHWALVVSLPGREGAAIYRWRNNNARLSAGQLLDIQERLAQVCTAAVTIHDGIQEELPLG